MQDKTVNEAAIPQENGMRIDNGKPVPNANHIVNSSANCVAEMKADNGKPEPNTDKTGYSEPDNTSNTHKGYKSNHSKSLRKKMIIKFIKLVGAMVGIFLLAGSIAILIINSAPNPSNNLLSNNTTAPTDTIAPQTPANDSSITQATEPPDSILLPPLITSFLIVGKDEGGYLTDVIIVGCFNSQTYNIDLISIPRDTMTIIPPDRLQHMEDLGLYPPADGTMKINAVNSYGREAYGIALLEQQLTDMLGIDFQYEIEINLQAFRNIIDDLGGVYFNVPSPGMYYNDPYQNLNIAIPPGFQYLDGANAEGLVRYRATYRDGDIQRIGVQQEFLKALFSQVLERDNILKNAFSISKNIIGYTKTNFSITDMPKYLRYINDITPDNIHFYTLPCDPQYINNISYVIPNSSQITDLINNIFYAPNETETSGTEITPQVPGTASETPKPTPPAISSIGLPVEILNGSGKAGVAGDFQKLLSDGGFTVTKIDTYTGVQMDKTQIIVRSEGMGADLTQYFKSSMIQVMPNMPDGYDIIIITGLDEK